MAALSLGDQRRSGLEYNGVGERLEPGRGKWMVTVREKVDSLGYWDGGCQNWSIRFWADCFKAWSYAAARACRANWQPSAVRSGPASGAAQCSSERSGGRCSNRCAEKTNGAQLQTIQLMQNH